MLARTALALSFFLLAVTGCRQATDLNNKCQLVRRDPADGGVLTIKEKEIKIGASKDFISFGSTDCEDFVCVRDSNFVRDPDPEAIALGYCSKSCLPASDCPSSDPGDDNKADRKLTCRALLLDAATISAICTATPSAPFCGVSSPYFCARGTNPDAGN